MSSYVTECCFTAYPAAGAGAAVAPGVVVGDTQPVPGPGRGTRLTQLPPSRRS